MNFQEKLNEIAELDSSILANYRPFEYYPNLSLPHAAIMNITNQCNLACPYCFHHQSDTHMSLETGLKVADFIMANAYKKSTRAAFTFFGGEPTLRFHEFIKPFVEALEGYPIDYTITTNGTLLNEEIVSFFYEHNIHPLLSMDGCKVVQDSCRPSKDSKSSFDKVAANIPLLLRFFPNTAFRATLSKESVPHLNETYKTVKQFGFEHFALIPNCDDEFPPGTELLLEDFISDRAIELLKSLRTLEMPAVNFHPLSSAINYYLNPTKPDFVPNKCGLGCGGIGVSVTGDFHPCQEDNGFVASGSIGQFSIDRKLHEEYLKKVAYNQLVYIKHCLEQEVYTPGARQYLAGLGCSHRMLDQTALNPISLNWSAQLYGAASRIYSLYHNTNNPLWKHLFEGGLKSASDQC